MIRTIVILTAVLALAGCGAKKGEVVARVKGFKITQGSLDTLYGSIQDAHTLRREPPRRRRFYNPAGRFSHIFPTLVSVMIHSIKSIPTLSMALEIRGFGLSGQRTVYRPLPSLRGRPLQWMGAIIVLLLLILLYFL